MLKKYFALCWTAVFLAIASGASYAADFTPSVTAPPTQETVRPQDSIPEESQMPIDPRGPKSPQTSDDRHGNILLGLMVTVTAASAINGASLVAKKRRQERR